MTDTTNDQTANIREAFLTAAEIPVVEYGCYCLGALLCGVGACTIVSQLVKGEWNWLSIWVFYCSAGLACIRTGYTGRQRRQERLTERPLRSASVSATNVNAYDVAGPS